METKHVFILNPAAGRHNRMTEIAAGIRSQARQCGVDYDIYLTEYPKHACELVNLAAAEAPGRPLRFYACGGDGTLNEVASAAVKLEHTAVGNYPIGTGNDFIKVFGEYQKFRSIQQLIMGEEVQVDTIESDCGAAFNVLSVGLDARVAKAAQKYKKLPLLGGHLPYLLATGESVLRGIGQAYGVEIDGLRYDDLYTLIFVANGRVYGGGFCPVPSADVTDGLLDVLLVRKVSRLSAARLLRQYKAGKADELPEYLTHLRAKELTVFSQSGSPMEINLDGEIVTSSRVSLRLGGKISFLVPAGVRPIPGRRG